jgi:hypothetical protein
MDFKYSLAKKGKVVCDNCGKKTAVQYVENETGNFVPGAMRCDRESNCGYHKKPDSNPVLVVSKDKIIEKKKTSFISIRTLDDIFSVQENDYLTQFLLTKFSEKEVLRVVRDYFISSINRKTVFWQIDELERVRTGKIMTYNSSNGKRVKNQEGKAAINWIHTHLKIDPFNLDQCLFGLHLVKEQKNKTIGLVESEKTAVVMSLFLPNFIWLATGGFLGFKYDRLVPIKHCKIIAFPDKGKFPEWQQKANELNGFGFSIVVNDFIEKSDNPPETDLADLYLNK